MKTPDFGLTQQQALWLAYYIGQSLHTSGLLTTGRDVMRVLHARWDQLGLPEDTLKDFERAILQDDHPFVLPVSEIPRRAIRVLAGDCPIGPIERIV